MEYNTIDGNVTIPAGGVGALLAGRYCVVRQLGQGGMGSVWLAEDTQLDNKLFAIKMLPSILVSNKRAYQQLKAEALVAMKLVHPNIVQLRAFEENDGNPFLVMDYVDGQTLDDYLCEKCKVESVKCKIGGGISEDEVVRILKPIAAALDYAHKKGVVHRDVKPGNVMIAKDGTPYILDFGIAREIQETMTRVTGRLSSGTLLYMLPEQLNGAAPHPMQDIYSFAAMAYECIKGEPPFSRGQIEHQILNSQPETLRSDGALAIGIMAGLAKKPEDRPATCEAVLDGDISGRVEHIERVDGVVGARRPAEPVGSRIPRDRMGSSGGARSRATAKILLSVALLSALAGGAWWWTNGRNGTEGTNGANAAMPAPVPPAPVSPTESDIAEISVEATVQKARVERIDDADGFKERKIALSDSLTRATANRREKRWAEAAQGFTNYVNECRKLLALDNERHTAKNSKVNAETAKVRASKADARQCAKPRWDATSALLEEANGAFEKMLFADAAMKYTAAAKQFDLCVDESKDYRVDAPLRRAKGHRDASKWQQCIDECDKVLGWDSGNVEAKKLKEEAEGHLVPSARVVAMVDGCEVSGAKFSDGRNVFILPVNWTLEDGKKYGPYDISYESGGKWYFGKFAEVTVDWKGIRSFSIVLKEYTGVISKNGHKGVQLWEGGPYWAETNIGAGKPEDYGYYFWWGDAIGYKRENNTWIVSDGSTSNFSFKDANTPTYGKGIDTLKEDGWVTMNGVLSPEHDAAHVHWGGNWRMPTNQELSDLVDKCDWAWTTMNSVNGYVVRGKGAYSSNNIFLPAAGCGDGALHSVDSYGYYWSSVPYSGSYDAWSLYFNSSHRSTSNYYRYYGRSVRPVQGVAK